MALVKIIAIKKSKTIPKIILAESGPNRTVIMPDEICVCCGRRECIPEGYMICWQCRKSCMKEC